MAAEGAPSYRASLWVTGEKPTARGRCAPSCPFSAAPSQAKTAFESVKRPGPLEAHPIWQDPSVGAQHPGIPPKHQQKPRQAPPRRWGPPASTTAPATSRRRLRAPKSQTAGPLRMPQQRSPVKQGPASNLVHTTAANAVPPSASESSPQGVGLPPRLRLNGTTTSPAPTPSTTLANSERSPKPTPSLSPCDPSNHTSNGGELLDQLIGRLARRPWIGCLKP